jgi:hypothetical protein
VGEAAGEGHSPSPAFLPSFSDAFFLLLAAPGGTMGSRPIVSGAEYKRAVEEISAYFETQPLPAIPDAARFDALIEA